MEEQEKRAEKELHGKRKTAVIVGASSGIGKETALRLTGLGWQVFNLSRTPFQGDRVRTVTVDAAQEGELTRAIKTVGDERPFDLLVYSAGVSFIAPVEYAKSGDYRYLFEVNYFGAIEAIRASLPYLKQRGGKIILVSSLGGEMPIPYDGFYSASKSALCMLAREVNLEVARSGVRVCALLPGGTATDFTYNRRVYEKEESASYAPAVKKASAALANLEQGGVHPSLVAQSIVKIAYKKNPPSVSAVNVKGGVLRAAYKLLPTRVSDWLTKRKFNQK